MIPPFPKLVRGNVVVVDLNDAQGHEQSKIRPAVVISSDFHNDRLDTVVIVPISSLKEGSEARAHEVLLKKGEGGLDVDSVAQPIQIRTIDRKPRVKRVLGKLPPLSVGRIGIKLIETLGLTSIP
jgi:mRNA interferase MazF